MSTILLLSILSINVSMYDQPQVNINMFPQNNKSQIFTRQRKDATKKGYIIYVCHSISYSYRRITYRIYYVYVNRLADKPPHQTSFFAHTAQYSVVHRLLFFGNIILGLSRGLVHYGNTREKFLRPNKNPVCCSNLRNDHKIYTTTVKSRWLNHYDSLVSANHVLVMFWIG